MRKLMIALTAVAALLPLDAYTLGLGDIEVKSALNQELNAEIELLSAAPEDAESLIVKLASREEFNRAGLDRPFLLQSLKFGNVVKDGVPYLTVTTSKPIREPFLNFLIEVDWPKGHLLREYTILLDPPVFINEPSSPRPAAAGGRPGAAEVPVVPATDSLRPGMSSRPAPSTATSTAPAAPPPPPPSAGSRAAPVVAPAFSAPRQTSEYRIKKGDTAWSLADSLRPDQSVSIEQMMLALLRTNPESFIDGNINGLKRGFILRIPDFNQISSVSQSEAVALVRQQNALWREYQQVASSSKPASATPNAKSGKTTAADDSSAARLSIISAGEGAASGTGEDLDGVSADELRAQLALVEERLESERLEKESLQGEVSALEQQVSKMKRLLSIEDKTLAEMQVGEVDAGQPGSPQTELTPEAEDLPVEPAPEDTAEIDSQTGVEPDADTDTAAADVAAEDMDSSSDENVFIDEQSTELAPTDTLEMQAEQQPEAPSSADDFISEQPAQPQGLVAQILNSPLVIAVAGGALLLVMALVYMIVKRRRASQSDDDSSAAAFASEDDDLANVADMLDDDEVSETVSDDEVKTSMAAAEADAEAFDSDATMILPSSEDTIMTQAEDAEEEEARDDIVAEADVYLAYGIYQQAEELLQAAINDNPENDAYRMKLAETYFAGKNTSGFNELAAEMHNRTKGTGARWQKLVAMGKELTPDNELFKGEAAVADVALDDLVPSPEPMDIDLGVEADSTADAEADLDFSLDDALDLPDESADETAVLDLDDMAEATSDADAEAENELEFDLSETEAAVPPDAAESEEEFSLDIEASELDIATDAEPADDKADADAAGLDFDLDLSAEADAEDENEDENEDEVATPADIEDASEEDIEFDIDVSEELTAATGSGSSTDDDAEIDLSDLSDVDEVSTKLDLARAYLDMGDNEGTRSILEEVIAEGNAEQKAEAEGILAEISG